jgi:hypothetical protein
LPIEETLAASIKEAASPSDLQQRENERAAVLFLSVDLVNSTTFKGREKVWPLVVSKFYEILRAICSRK